MVKKETTNKHKIFLSSDDNYFTHLFVTISSVLDNCSDTSKIEFFVFDGGIKEKNKVRLDNYVRERKSTTQFIQVNSEKYKNRKVWGHFSTAIYYRLEIPQVEKKDKVVYLDCDLVVLEDILKLFEFDLNGKTLGAVYDYGLRSSGQLNSGVLLIDCEKWNKKKYSSKIMHSFDKWGNNLKWLDQDILNYVFKEDIMFLPLEWNFQRSIFDLTLKQMKLSKKEYDNLILNPKIVHYVGRIKPWNYKYCFPDKKYYLKWGGDKLGKINYAEKSFYSLLYRWLRWISYKFKLMNLIKKLK